MKILYIFFLLIIPNLSIAQIDSKNPFKPIVFSNSPNSASLGQYNPFEIDLFSGNPNISFNLFEYNKDNYNLNIDISYNLSSVKPDIPPTWVGVGWNLNVGGVITRTVKGGVDEVLINNYTPNNKFSYYDNYNNLAISDWDSNSKLNQFMNDNRSIGNGNLGVYPSPDEFNFNVNGMNGSFFKNHEGKWVISSGNFIDIKIEDELKSDFILNEDGLKSTNNKTHVIKRIIYGFTLTDTNGIKYIFGKTPESIEFSATPYGNPDTVYNSDFIANSWYLTKVITPNNFQIIYNYERENKAFFKINSSYAAMYTKIGNVMKRFQKPSHIAERTFVTYLKNININNLYSIDFYKSIANVEEYDYTKVTNDPWTNIFGYTHHYQTDIKSVKHFYKLDRIVINKGSISEEISFNYLENSNKKLYLNSFIQKNKKYRLEYFSTDLPKYNQMKNDHWGYYNNKSILSVTPTDGIYYSSEQLRNTLPLLKDTDPSQLTKGVLKKVIFPTNGSTEFFYEPHDYSKIVSVNTLNPHDFYIENTTKKIAGGLRVKKTITDSGEAQKIVKEYFYTDNGTLNGNSTGVLSGNPIYYEEDQNSISRIFRFADMPIIPSNNTRGKHITYSKVTERVSGSNDGGSTEYIFTNNDNGYIDVRANNFIIQAFTINNSSLYNNLRKLNYNNTEIERGKPLSIIVRNNLNQIVQQTNYIYRNEFSRFDDRIRAYDYQSNIYGEALTNGPYTELNGMAELQKISAYNIYSYHPYLNKKEVITYDQNGNSIIDFEEYKYNNSTNHLLKEIKKINSKNESLITEYQYPPDWGGNAAADKLTAQNRIAEPIFTTVKNGDKVISSLYTEYNDFNGIVQKARVFQKKGSASMVEGDDVVRYNSYDAHGNITQYTPTNGIPVSIIWGYNGQYPVAKLEGVTLSQINAATITTLKTKTTDAELLAAISTLRTTHKDAMVTGYLYKPLVGVTQIIQPNGVSEKYNYDNYDRLKSIVNDKDEIVKIFEYNFNSISAPIFYNDELNYIVYKNCADNQFSDPVTYRINSNTYQSYISVEDANTLAKNSEHQTAQNYANNIGLCTNYDCQFYKESNFTFSFNQLSKFDNNTIRLQGAFFVTHNDLQNVNYKWYEGVQIGQVDGNCRPLVRQYFTSDYINASSPQATIKGFIEPNGRVYIILLGVNANTYVQFDFKYQRR